MTSALRLIMRSSKTGHKTPIETKCCQYPPLQFLLTKIRSTWPNNDRHWLTVTAAPCLFSKKSSSIMALDQNVCVWVFCAPNATILLVYIPINIKMSFIWKDDFFFAKIGIFCKSKRIQAYTQPYSLGGRIKVLPFTKKQ